MKWQHRPPYVIELAIISVLLVLIMVKGAFAAEVQYVMPRIPSEREKIEALQLGYIMNGFSMVRHPKDGAIDVSKGFEPTSLSPPPGVVRTIPIVPSKKKDRDK